MPETVGASQVNINEQQAHDNCSDGKQLTQDDDIMKRLVMVHIGGNDQHYRGGGKSYDEREVSDVRAPMKPGWSFRLSQGHAQTV